MRRTILLVALLAGLAACGVSAAAGQMQRRSIGFGIAGGNIVPFHVLIKPDGAVLAQGRTVAHKHLDKNAAKRLREDVRAVFSSGDVSSRQCSGTNPDVGTQFIRFGVSTIKVHGGCEPRFTHLWNELADAVGLG